MEYGTPWSFKEQMQMQKKKKNYGIYYGTWCSKSYFYVFASDINS